MAKKVKPTASSATAKKASPAKAAKAAAKSVPARKNPPKRKPAKAKAPAPAATAVVAAENSADHALPLAQQFASFEAAKEATIDALLEIIEAAEDRLGAVKQVRTFEQLEPLANGQL